MVGVMGSIRPLHCGSLMAHALAAKSLMISGGALNIAVKPGLERIHRLFVMEIVSPLGIPETAMAARLGSDLSPDSCAKAEIAVEIVD